ncbi:hypothetical protein SLEP1_g20809 [Rubroshorea leprosula]|uniref:Uncharacterized protein n=1 Tax=Rubroshorea leprosula TaxID=152421 RepID=A0AAV5JCZ4_9ROSI|nr:hypothetical protein SLEP1_g20809 [Rubroshorea leprosula]
MTMTCSLNSQLTSRDIEFALKSQPLTVQNPPKTGIIQSYGSIEPPPDFLKPDDDEEIEDDEDRDDEDAFSNNSSDDDSDDSGEKVVNEDIELGDTQKLPHKMISFESNWLVMERSRKKTFAVAVM